MTPVSAPPLISPSKEFSDDHDATSYSNSALDNLHVISSKSDGLIETSMDDNDIGASSDSAIGDKNDNHQNLSRTTNKSKQSSTRKNDEQRQQLKVNSNRITVDTFPIHPYTRSKINGQLSSAKGK